MTSESTILGMEETSTVENMNHPGFTTRVSKVMYDAMQQAM
jgi:hypothetical protein